MKDVDRLAALAYRQLYLPVRDFAFVAAMVALTALSLTAVGAAASTMMARADAPPTLIAPANDNLPACHPTEVTRS